MDVFACLTFNLHSTDRQRCAIESDVKMSASQDPLSMSWESIWKDGVDKRRINNVFWGGSECNRD